MNRVFPATPRPQNGLAEQLAKALADEILAHSDALLDFHLGIWGSTLGSTILGTDFSRDDVQAGCRAMAEAFGWRGAALGMAAVAALAAAPLLGWGAWRAERFAAETGAAARAAGRAPAPEAPSPGWRAEMARPGAWRIALAFACVAGSHGVVSAHMLALLPTRGLGPEAAVAVAAAVGPCQVAGRLALLSAPARWRAASLLPAAFAALAAGFAVLLLGHGIAAAALFAALLGSAYGATTILRPVVLAETAGTERFGTLSGLVAAPFAASFALAPFLGGVLREAGGATLAIGAAGTLPLIGFALVLPLALRRG